MKRALLLLVLAGDVSESQEPVHAVALTNTPVMLTPTSTTPLRVAAVGTLFRVLKDDGEWVQIEFRDPQLGARIGFVSRRNVQIRDPQLEPLDLSVTKQTTSVPDAFAPRPAPRSAPGRAVRTVEGGILDEVRLFTNALPRAESVAITMFSASDSDLREGEIKEQTRAMQAAGPGILARRVAAKLRELGAVRNVVILGEGSAPQGGISLEGRFYEIDPGSRAKRYFVGFGAGKSAVGVEGTVRASDGSVLATFKQRRVGVMGAFGGDSMGKLTSDVNSIGEDIAEFIDAWLRGQPLK